LTPLTSLTNPDQFFRGDRIIHADRDVAFKAIKKVFYSGALAGHIRVQLVTQRPDR